MNILKFAAVLFVTFMFLNNVISANGSMSNELSADELRFIAQSMKVVEDSLLNVRIDSNAWAEQGVSSTGLWEKTPISWSTTAILGNISSDKARIDFHKDITKWVNGAAPYMEESYSVSFDGVKSKRKNISNSYNGKTFIKNNGEIMPDKPSQLTGCDKITGIKASLFFYYRNVPAPLPKRFSAAFEGAADPNSFISGLAAADPNYLNFKSDVKVKVSIDELEGIQCIKMSCIGGFKQEWWFDPNRGYALLRFDKSQTNTDGNEQVVSSINVTKLEKVAEKIWWPMEAYFVEHPNKNDNNWTRIIYQASNVIVNDPNFDNSVFNIAFPKGYKVDDMVNRKNYKVDTNFNMIEEPNYKPDFETIRQGHIK